MKIDVKRLFYRNTRKSKVSCLGDCPRPCRATKKEGGLFEKQPPAGQAERFSLYDLF